MTLAPALTNTVADKINTLWLLYLADGSPDVNGKIESTETRTFDEKLNTLYAIYMETAEIGSEEEEPSFGPTGSLESRLNTMWIANQLGWIPAGVGGGDEVYVADAVHFDGSAYLSIASLDATDNGLISYSCWFKIAAYDDVSGHTIFVSSAEDLYLNQNLVHGTHVYRSFFEDGVSGTISASSIIDVPLDSWINVLVCADTNHEAHAKILKVYINDTDVTDTIGDLAASFESPFDGLSLTVGSDTFNSGIVGDVADIWIAPGQFVDFTIEANRRKFINEVGKPVDLGLDGSTPTGTAPAVFFSGDATGFVTNQGLGGAAILTGSLITADTSPSD